MNQLLLLLSYFCNMFSLLAYLFHKAGAYTMKTYRVKTNDIKQNWCILDAKNQVLGRVAAMVAKKLLGKDKVIYSPDADVGDYVIVINAEHIKVTGNKSQDKLYYRHSGRPGNLKEINFNKLIKKSAEQLLKITVKGMLPKNTRGRNMLKKLKVYSNMEHPHMAQQPKHIPVALSNADGQNMLEQSGSL